MPGDRKLSKSQKNTLNKSNATKKILIKILVAAVQELRKEVKELLLVVIGKIIQKEELKQEIIAQKNLMTSLKTNLKKLEV